MREYKFLFDNDSQAAAKFFPEKRVVTLAQAKLSPAASDATIVARASELGSIIVTAATTTKRGSNDSFRNRNETIATTCMGS